VGGGDTDNQHDTFGTPSRVPRLPAGTHIPCKLKKNSGNKKMAMVTNGSLSCSALFPPIYSFFSSIHSWLLLLCSYPPPLSTDASSSTPSLLLHFFPPQLTLFPLLFSSPSPLPLQLTPVPPSLFSFSSPSSAGSSSALFLLHFLCS
jgi:hypothetical protein